MAKKEAPSRAEPAGGKAGRPRFAYIRDMVSELKKVVWLNRRELAYLTGLVLLVCVATALVLGILDYGFSQLMEKVFLGR